MGLVWACPGVRAISKDVNGPLLEALIAAVGHSDPKCPDLFRTGECFACVPGLPVYVHGILMLAGSALYGTLECAGIGEPVVVQNLQPEEELRRDTVNHNREVLGCLREDPLSRELMRITREEASQGRMTQPVPGVHVSLSLNMSWT